MKTILFLTFFPFALLAVPVGPTLQNPKITGVSSGAANNTALLRVDTTTGALTYVTASATALGLGNVDNTSDANKPVSTLTQTALDLKADLISPTFTTTQNFLGVQNFTGTTTNLVADVTNLGVVNNLTNLNGELHFDTDVSFTYDTGIAEAHRTALGFDDGSAELTVLSLATEQLQTTDIVTLGADVVFNGVGISYGPGVAAAHRTALGLGSLATTTPGTGIATALAVNVGSDGAPILFNGVAGTPASLTLTNATGLPVSGLTASTSDVLGVGSIELGHATDTTLARVSSGVFSVEGVTVPTISSTSALTNKTIALGSNTITGTTAQFNTALTDGDFATLAGTESLSNKTFTGSTYFGTLYALSGGSVYSNSGANYIGINTNGTIHKLFTTTAVDINISPNDTAAIIAKATNQVVETKGGRIGKVTNDISTSLTLTSAHDFVTLSNAGAVTLNLPAGVNGTRYTIKNKGSGTITITPNGSQKLFTTSQVATLALVTGKACIIIFDGTDWSVVSDY